MAIQKTCISCNRITTIPTNDGIPLPDQKCSFCGFRFPNVASRPQIKSSDWGP